MRQSLQHAAVTHEAWRHELLRRCHSLEYDDFQRHDFNGGGRLGCTSGSQEPNDNFNIFGFTWLQIESFARVQGLVSTSATDQEVFARPDQVHREEPRSRFLSRTL